jgi:hypothetical protein
MLVRHDNAKDTHREAYFAARASQEDAQIAIMTLNEGQKPSILKKDKTTVG